MNNYLLFLLAGRVFAVKIQGAIEIVPWRPLTTVPMSYSYVDGLLDYRGAVYPVFNLASRLGISESGSGRGAEPAPQSIILLEEKDQPFGIAADIVLRMTSLAEHPASSEKMRGVDPRYVKGYVADEYHKALILDFERLFHAG